MPDKMHLYAPFSKVEATSDGGREVWGFASLEVVDKTGEIADFERTCKAFEEWSSEIEKATNGKSKGNIRYQHGNDAVGKMIAWQPGEKALEGGETAKGVYIGVKVPSYETRTIGQIDDGILTGFSIGGSYADRWYDETAKAFRYAPKLAETSLVDNPAVPGANFDLIRMQKGVMQVNPDLLKATEEERKKLHDEAEERAKKYGIAFKEKDGGNLTPPKGKPTSASEYGDPTNYKYPIDEKHIKAAVSYFNHPDEREKGGYSESEWEIIGKRIADAANKLIGEGHEYKGGKIETDDNRKEADKAAWAELQKRADTGGELSFNDKRQLVQAAIGRGPGNEDYWVMDMYDDYAIVESWEEAKTWKLPYTIEGTEAKLGTPEEVRQVWEAVDADEGMKGAEKNVGALVTKREDPNDKTVNEKIEEVERMLRELKAAQEKDQGKDPDQGDKAVDAKIKELEDAIDALKRAQEKDDEGEGEEDEKDAEKAHEAAELLKAVAGKLAKRGSAISAHRRKHMRHAIDHIHHALGEDDKVEDKAHCELKEDDKDESMKAALGDLQKRLGTDFGTMLAKAIDTAALAKAADVAKIAEDLIKAAETLASLDGRVKAIEEQPAGNGPVMSPVPGLGGAMPWQGNVEKAALEGLMQKTSDPVLRDAIGRELATSALEGRLAAQRTGARNPARPQS